MLGAISGMRRVPVPVPNMSAFVERACVVMFWAVIWKVEILLACIVVAERKMVEPTKAAPDVTWPMAVLKLEICLRT